MQPHKLLEFLPQAIKPAKDGQRILTIEGDAVADLDAETRAAVYFDCRAVRVETTHAAFGLDLVRRDLFRLPFEQVWFDVGSLIREGSQDPVITQHHSLLARQRDDEVKLWLIETLDVRHPEAGRHVMPIPSVVVCFKLGDLKAWGAGESIPAQWDSVSMIWRRDEGALNDRAGASIFVLLGYTALLMSKDVEICSEPAPNRLNRTRIAKGKPPIGAINTVKIRVDVARRAGIATCGTHASPRMHWRRGHYRHLSSGKIIPIAPTIVGINRDQAAPSVKDYLVEMGRAERPDVIEDDGREQTP